MACDLMVIPRSRSKSILSNSCAWASRAVTVCVASNKRSARVLFPWSICAIIQKFLICFIRLKYLKLFFFGRVVSSFLLTSGYLLQVLILAGFSLLSLTQHPKAIKCKDSLFFCAIFIDFLITCQSFFLLNTSVRYLKVAKKKRP